MQLCGSCLAQVGHMGGSKHAVVLLVEQEIPQCIATILPKKRKEKRKARSLWTIAGVTSHLWGKVSLRLKSASLPWPHLHLWCHNRCIMSVVDWRPGLAPSYGHRRPLLHKYVRVSSHKITKEILLQNVIRCISPISQSINQYIIRHSFLVLLNGAHPVLYLETSWLQMLCEDIWIYLVTSPPTSGSKRVIRHYSLCPFSPNKARLLARPPSHRTWYSLTEAYSSPMKESVSGAGGGDVTLLTQASPLEGKPSWWLK